MTELEEKYTELLQYFNTYTYYDNLLQTRSYVSMDNIHDAILKVGLFMNAPLNYYIVRAKQNAINDQTANKRHYDIITKNIRELFRDDIEPEVILEYGFNEIELELIYELLAGVKAYASAIPRRQYNKIMEGIRAKIRLAL